MPLWKTLLKLKNLIKSKRSGNRDEFHRFLDFLVYGFNSCGSEVNMVILQVSMGLRFLNNHGRCNVKHLKDIQGQRLKLQVMFLSKKQIAYWLTDLVIPTISLNITHLSSRLLVPNKVLLITRVPICEQSYKK